MTLGWLSFRGKFLDKKDVTHSVVPADLKLARCRRRTVRQVVLVRGRITHFSQNGIKLHVIDVMSKITSFQTVELFSLLVAILLKELSYTDSLEFYSELVMDLFNRSSKSFRSPCPPLFPHSADIP